MQGLEPGIGEAGGVESPEPPHEAPLVPLEGTLALPAPVCGQKDPWVGVPHAPQPGGVGLEVPGWPAASLSEWGAHPT